MEIPVHSEINSTSTPFLRKFRAIWSLASAFPLKVDCVESFSVFFNYTFNFRMSCKCFWQINHLLQFIILEKSCKNHDFTLDDFLFEIIIGILEFAIKKQIIFISCFIGMSMSISGNMIKSIASVSDNFSYVIAL